MGTGEVQRGWGAAPPRRRRGRRTQSAEAAEPPGCARTRPRHKAGESRPYYGQRHHTIAARKGRKYMTKRWDRALIFGLLLALVISMAAGFDNRCEAVRENVLRLHILANSDSEEDQALKLRVRDAILRETAESFAQSGSREETGRLARALLPKIEETARATLEAAGCTDAVRAGLVHMYFDTREYDGTILPAGYYDAVRIELGRAEGRNWWCVLFPQLCIGTAADCAGLEQIEQLAEGPEYRLRFALAEWLERLLAAGRG